MEQVKEVVEEKTPESSGSLRIVLIAIVVILVLIAIYYIYTDSKNGDDVEEKIKLVDSFDLKSAIFALERKQAAYLNRVND